MKVKFLSAKRPIFSELYGVYDMNHNLSAKQWSLTPNSIKIRTSYVYISVWSTISSLDNHFLGTCFPISLSILCSTHSMELGDNVTLGVGFWEEDSGGLSTLRCVSLIIVSLKVCCSFVLVIFVDDTSLNPFWWHFLSLPLSFQNQEEIVSLCYCWPNNKYQWYSHNGYS